MNKTKIEWSDCIWSQVPGFPDYYASEDGRILSTKKNVPRIMKPITSKDGHLYVFMYIDGTQYKMWVHRAILSAWKGLPNEGDEGRHLDDDPANNHIQNLEWGTKLENANDKRINGGIPNGERSGTHRLTESDVMEIRTLHGSVSLRKLAKRYGVSHTAIRRAAVGATWAHIQEGNL